MNGRGAAAAGFGEIYFAGTGVAGITVAGADTTGAGAGEAGVAGDGATGAAERTPVSEASFPGIWIPVEILEPSFCNPSLPLCIVQILRGL